MLGWRSGRPRRFALTYFLAQRLEQLFPPGPIEFALKLAQRERDYVVVVQLPQVTIGSQLEPHLVQQRQVLAAQPRRVRAEFVVPLRALGSHDLQRERRSRRRQPLPRVAGEFALLVGRELVGEPADNARR